MKSLQRFISENNRTSQETFINHNGKHIVNDKTHVRAGDLSEVYKKISQKYLDILGKDNIIKIIKQTLDDSNEILNNLCVCTNKLQNIVIYPASFLTGQTIGRIVEATLARNLNISLNNEFEFVHGSENNKDKDIICKKIPEKLKSIFTTDEITYMRKNWQGPGKKTDDFLKLPKYFGFELKTQQGTGATGNKSYAADIYDETDEKKQFKDRSSFYFIINYDKPKSKTNIQLKNVKVYFGILDQSDWIFYASSGSSSKINNELLSKRFISIL